MYNDYYLQQIDNKLNTTNSSIQEIIDNQEVIIQQQQQLISGDTIIQVNQEANTKINTIAVFILAILLLYKFVERCFR